MTIDIDQIEKIDFKKVDGLIPAIIQDIASGRVLMLGYMNEEAVRNTLQSGLVTFYSRSKGRLWTKGESSGNYLNLVSVDLDCDGDTLLVTADPSGPTCHTGDDTCFGNGHTGISFLADLQKLIAQRKKEKPEGSYTTTLFEKGVDAIAQKVGEEAVEVVIASKNEDRDLFLGECADLLYHLLVLLESKDTNLLEVAEKLQSRHIK